MELRICLGTFTASDLLVGWTILMMAWGCVCLAWPFISPCGHKNQKMYRAFFSVCLVSYACIQASELQLDQVLSWLGTTLRIAWIALMVFVGTQFARGRIDIVKQLRRFC